MSRDHRFLVPRAARRAALLLLAGLLVASPCFAIFVDIGEPVPIERLLANVGRFVERNPRNAQGHYTLGRLHSLAFAMKSARAEVRMRGTSGGEAGKLPQFSPMDTIVQRRPVENGKLDAPARRHLVASVRHYQVATRLAPQRALYWLGLGWMLEQGARHAGEVEAPFLARPGKRSADAWRERALAAYRRAYALDLSRDLKLEGLGPESDPAISLEAGEGILRILERRPRSPAQKAEVARVRRSVKALQGKPRAITPILFPLDGNAALDALLAPGRDVSFDLAGDGRKERWPWVGPNAGILVWDPGRTGRIASGRQLFGSATWSLFWRDGYAPLSALDDNGDGWLAGGELAGIAVWCDADGDGVSEAGEVRSLVEAGIARVAVRPAGRIGGALSHPRGLQRRDGTFAPTYDWTPASR